MRKGTVKKSTLALNKESSREATKERSLSPSATPEQEAKAKEQEALR